MLILISKIYNVLFFSEINPNWHSFKIKMLPQLVFEVVSVGNLDVVGVIRKECERWDLGRQLGDVFDGNGMATNNRCMIGCDGC